MNISYPVFLSLSNKYEQAVSHKISAFFHLQSEIYIAVSEVKHNIRTSNVGDVCSHELTTHHYPTGNAVLKIGLSTFNEEHHLSCKTYADVHDQDVFSSRRAQA